MIPLNSPIHLCTIENTYDINLRFGATGEMVSAGECSIRLGRDGANVEEVVPEGM